MPIDLNTAKSNYDAACREQNEANSAQSKILRQSGNLFRMTDRKFAAAQTRVKTAATNVASARAQLDAARRAAGGR
jgi:hypothetical protein